MLLPVLREFNAISWDQFGLPEEETFTTDWKLINNAQVPLLSVIQAEIAVMDLDGMEYWPLSLTGECPRLIPETVSVMLINPWSIQASGALAFMEYTWDNLDVLAKMSLDPVMDGPVENTAYAEDIAYLEQLVSSYQKQIDAAGTDEEAEALRQEMSDAEEFLSDYLLVSESSIAEYRALASQFVPAVPEFWSADEEDAAVLQFLDGMMPAEQFVTQFVSALKMSLLEGE